MAQAKQDQQLSSKDGNLFRQVVRHFENKQYKKGMHIITMTALALRWHRSQSRRANTEEEPQPCRYPSDEGPDNRQSGPYGGCFWAS